MNMNKTTNKTLGELLSKSKDYQLIGLPSQTISSIAYNSQKVRPGACFVAIKGETADGHNFIADAIWSGAKAVICEKLPARELITPDVAFIVTDDSRKLLSEVSHAFYNFPADKLKIIGVTGTNGKTTCTFLIKSMIESDNKICGIIGTTGIFVGNKKIDATHTTPESLELAEILSIMVDAGAEFVVMEVSSHSLVQNRTAGINFSAAMFTNLTHEHLDYHKTMDEYAKAKKILFERLSPDSYAIINSDDPYSEFMVNEIECQNIITVGRKPDCNFRIMRQKSDLRGIEFIIFSDMQLIDVNSSLTGDFNIDNAALSASVCKTLGISIQAVQHGLSVTTGAPGRMQRIDLQDGVVALVDYAHTPDALEKALTSCRKSILSSENKKGRLICVFGCGGDRDKTKRPEMGRISSAIADISIITSDNPRTENPLDIIEDIKSGIKATKGIFVIPDRSEAIAKVVELSKSGDLVLVAGKGHEDYQIIGTEKIHFDDVEELKKLVRV